MMKQIIPICVPKLPLAESIFPYLQQIDTNRWYTNYGPLVCEFLARMASLFNVARTQVISASNGTLMLELCLKAMNIPNHSLCIMPSWTFVATPLAAVNANLRPYFVDVELDTQTIDPIKLEKSLPAILATGEIGAVIAVTPFGMPVNVKAWDDFTERTGIPVIIDAAAGFDAALQLPQMKIGKTPMMISLHATKVMGIGEAAILFSQHEALINQIECLTQFGFPRGVRDAECFGTNAKISEYVGAVGLAALDVWQETRKAWKTISDYYQTCLNEAGIEHTLTHDWVSSTCNVMLPHQANDTILNLEAAGIMARKWYGDGCHQQSVFKNAPYTDLNHTAFLAASNVGLPFYIGMEKNVIEQVVEATAGLMNSSQKKMYA